MSGSNAATLAGLRGHGGLISAAAGTATGNMIEAGGLAAAFDGVTSQISTSCAQLANTSTAGTVGKDWGAGVTHTLKSCVVYGPNNFGIARDTSNVSQSVTVTLEGSSDGSAWTSLTTAASGSGSSAVLLFVPNSVTAYRHHRVSVAAFDSSSDKTIAEVQFFE